MIILRQKIYAKKDYLDIKGNPLHPDLIRRVQRQRGRIKSRLEASRKQTKKDYTGEGKSIFAKIFLPDYTGDVKERNNRYNNALEYARDSATAATRDAQAIQHFRKVRSFMP